MLSAFPINCTTQKLDCGSKCLQMVCSYYNEYYSLDYLNEKCKVNNFGCSLGDINDCAISLRYNTMIVKLRYGYDKNSLTLRGIPLPAIAYIFKNHFVVVHKVNKHSIYLTDPAEGILTMERRYFEKAWCDVAGYGIVLLIEKLDH